MPRIALDTNVLVYSEGLTRVPGDAPKIALSRNLLRALDRAGEFWIVSTQALAEFHHVQVRRAGLAPREATRLVRRLLGLSRQVDTSFAVLDAALDLSADHNLQIYDAIILAAAAESRCDLLATEDLHDGFSWRGVTVTNPFGPSPDPRLVTLLSRS